MILGFGRSASHRRCLLRLLIKALWKKFSALFSNKPFLTVFTHFISFDNQIS